MSIALDRYPVDLGHGETAAASRKVREACTSNRIVS
jgi:hypothetical protein